MLLRSVVNFEDKIAVQAIGALVGFLMESASRNALESKGEGLAIQTLQHMSLANFMHVSAVSAPPWLPAAYHCCSSDLNQVQCFLTF
jgi:hypothetical protein